MAELLILSVAKRKETAVKVQEILTDSECMVKTRLGIHSGDAACQDNGIIILEMAPSSYEKIKELIQMLGDIDGVKVKQVSI